MTSHHDYSHIIVEASLEYRLIDVAHHGMSVGVDRGLAFGQRLAS